MFLLSLNILPECIKNKADIVNFNMQVHQTDFNNVTIIAHNNIIITVTVDPSYNKVQGKGEMSLLQREFIISRFFSMHFTIHVITKLKNMVHHTRVFVIKGSFTSGLY